MTGLTSTNVQYYVVLGLLKDATDYGLDRCLERDMLALVEEAPTSQFSLKGDVRNLASMVIRIFEKAGISVVEALGEESDYNPSVDQTQVIKDLFVLHLAIKDFVKMTWNGEPAQQLALDELVGKTLAAAVHSRTVLRNVHHKAGLVSRARAI